METGGTFHRVLGLECMHPGARKWLEARGVAVEVVGSAQVLLRRVRDGRCDLVLLPTHRVDLLPNIRLAARQDELLPVVVMGGDHLARTQAILHGADLGIASDAAHEEVAAQLTALLRLRDRNVALLAAKEKLETLSITDDLTGLHNKRWLLARLQEETSRAERYRDGLALVLFDLDHFKRINDAHGHLFGDRVLQAFADLLRQSFRGVDRIARFGGEEFAVILPETSTAGAVDAIERFRKAVEERLLAGVAVTTSAGVASYRAGEVGAGPESLLRDADDALYQAKRAGRNRVVVAGQPAATVPAAQVRVAAQH